MDPNSWVEFCDPVFLQQKRPPEKFTLEKFTSQNSTQKSGQKIHIAPLQGHFTKNSSRDLSFRSLGPLGKFPGWMSCGRRGGHSCGRPGPKTPVRHSESWKNRHVGADIHDLKARTSMTRGGFRKTSVRRTSGLCSVPKLLQGQHVHMYTNTLHMYTTI